MGYSPEDEERLEKISEIASQIAKEKYIRPMTRIFLFIVSGILLVFGLLLILKSSSNLVVGIVLVVVACIIIILNLVLLRKKVR